MILETGDIFKNGKIVDDFITLDKNNTCTLNVSATQKLHKNIMEPKVRTNDLENRLAR
jgi:hypothetical protein